MKKIYLSKKFLLLIVLAALNTVSLHAFAHKNDISDYRASRQNIDITNMENFHLKHAQQKILQQQAAYAWGDFAYILCQIPNHHLVLKEMTQLAVQLNKEAEMRKYFMKAMQMYPDDQEIVSLYDDFVASVKR